MLEKRRLQKQGNWFRKFLKEENPRSGRMPGLRGA